MVQGAEIELKDPQQLQKEGQVTGELGLEGESAGEGRGGAGVGLDLWAGIRDPILWTALLLSASSICQTVQRKVLMRPPKLTSPVA